MYCHITSCSSFYFSIWWKPSQFTKKTRKQNCTVEGYSKSESPGLFPDSENAQAICKIHLENPAIIDKTCKTFSENNCETVDCCVWKNEKCVGGKNNRPIYLSS